jgi:hypothetical protein
MKFVSLIMRPDKLKHRNIDSINSINGINI